MQFRSRCWLLGLLMFAVSQTAPSAQGQEPAKGKDVFNLIGLTHRLKGRIVDHTANHGLDNRR